MLILMFILIVIGLGELVWFCMPIAMYRIINVGNLSGIILSLALIFSGVFLKQIIGFFRNVWKIHIGKTVLSVLLGIVVLGLIFVLVESVLIIRANYNHPDENATVVVLGCKVKRNCQPTLTLRERIDAAYDYLLEHPDAICIVSGGKGSDEGISEAECMYRELVEKGIGKERIYKEDKSTSTRENIAFSKEIIEREGLNPKIAIVTNEFHEYRALTKI